jgi:hypothetical protein
MRSQVRIFVSAILLTSLLAGCGSKTSTAPVETEPEIITTTTLDPGTSVAFSYSKKATFRQIPIEIKLAGQLTNMRSDFNNESPPYAHLSTYCECLLTVTNLDPDYPVTIESFGKLSLKLSQDISLTIQLSGEDIIPTIQPGQTYTESTYLFDYETSNTSPTGTTTKAQVNNAIKRMQASKPLAAGIEWNNTFCYLFEGNIASIDMGVYSVSCSPNWSFGE